MVKRVIAEHIAASGEVFVRQIKSNFFSFNFVVCQNAVRKFSKLGNYPESFICARQLLITGLRLGKLSGQVNQSLKFVLLLRSEILDPNARIFDHNQKHQYP